MWCWYRKTKDSKAWGCMIWTNSLWSHWHAIKTCLFGLKNVQVMVSFGLFPQYLEILARIPESEMLRHEGSQSPLWWYSRHFRSSWTSSTFNSAAPEALDASMLKQEIIESLMNLLWPEFPKVWQRSYLLIENYNMPIRQKSQDRLKRINRILKETLPKYINTSLRLLNIGPLLTICPPEGQV